MNKEQAKAKMEEMKKSGVLQKGIHTMTTCAKCWGITFHDGAVTFESCPECGCKTEEARFQIIHEGQVIESHQVGEHPEYTKTVWVKPRDIKSLEAAGIEYRHAEEDD